MNYTEHTIRAVLSAWPFWAIAGYALYKAIKIVTTR